MQTATRPAFIWKAFFIAAMALFLAACNPIAIIEVNPTKVVVDEEVTFDGSGTLITATPEGTTAVKYEWEFGDGEEATGAEVTHTYTRTGNFTVTLTVTDSAGRTGTSTEIVKVGEASDDDETDSTEEGTEDETDTEA
jgi:PKD repeat protein